MFEDFCWKYFSNAFLLRSTELIKSIDVSHLIKTLSINDRRWSYALIWKSHRMISFLFDPRKLVTISWTFCMTSAKNENLMMSLNNSCSSWLSQNTKKTCFMSENFEISAHIAFMMKHVSMTIQLILHVSWLIVSLQSFINHSAWTTALIFSATSIVAFKWNLLSLRT